MSKSKDRIEHTDRIEYTDEFRQHVQGELKGRFQLDPDKRPVYEPHPDDRQLRCYTIYLYLSSPVARSIRGVTYFMDDSSFVDPEGYSANSQDNFEEEVTSYGDVEVKVTIEMANGDEYTQRAWLSHMLENGHRGEKNPAVRAAIERIERN